MTDSEEQKKEGQFGKLVKLGANHIRQTIIVPKQQGFDDTEVSREIIRRCEILKESLLPHVFHLKSWKHQETSKGTLFQFDLLQPSTLVLERIDGHPKWIKKNLRLNLLRQMLTALHHLHERNIFFGDLSVYDWFQNDSLETPSPVLANAHLGGLLHTSKNIMQREFLGKTTYKASVSQPNPDSDTKLLLACFRHFTGRLDSNTQNLVKRLENHTFRNAGEALVQLESQIKYAPGWLEKFSVKWVIAITLFVFGLIGWAILTGRDAKIAKLIDSNDFLQKNVSDLQEKNTSAEKENHDLRKQIEKLEQQKSDGTENSKPDQATVTSLALRTFNRMANSNNAETVKRDELNRILSDHGEVMEKEVRVLVDEWEAWFAKTNAYTLNTTKWGLGPNSPEANATTWYYRIKIKDEFGKTLRDHSMSGKNDLSEYVITLEWKPGEEIELSLMSAVTYGWDKELKKEKFSGPYALWQMYKAGETFQTDAGDWVSFEFKNWNGPRRNVPISATAGSIF